MAFHKGVTLLTEVNPDQLENLEKVLKEYNNQIEAESPNAPFSQFDHVHFARWVILYERQDVPCNSDDYTPHTLLYTASVDGYEKDHLAHFVEQWPEGLDRIYGCCLDYPGSAKDHGPEVFRWLDKQRLKSTFYSGMVGLSLDQLRQEDTLHQRIQAYLDESQEGLRALTAIQVRNNIQDFVKSQTDLKWALSPAKMDWTSRWQTYGPLYRLIGVLGLSALCLIAWIVNCFTPFMPIWLYAFTSVGGAIFLFVVLFLVLLFLSMRLDEIKEKKQSTCERPPRSDEEIAEILGAEHAVVQTHYTAVEFTKNRMIRYIWQTVILWVVTRLSPTIFVPTVHAARWFQIPSKKQVIFVSNFDGDSESYLHAFIDISAIVRSMNLMYGSTVGFPTTRWLIREGANSRQGYMKVTRVAQAKTNVWFCAIPHLSVENKKNNKMVRAGLSGTMSEQEAQAWLRRF